MDLNHIETRTDCPFCRFGIFVDDVQDFAPG